MKAFNYQKIYLAPRTKAKFPLIRECYSRLFKHYLALLNNSPQLVSAEVDLMTDVTPIDLQNYRDEEKVRDFIAGMTDDFFLKQAQIIGCTIPLKE